MKIKINTLLLIGLIIGLILAIYISGYRTASKAKDRAYSAVISATRDTVNTYFTTIKGLSISVSEKEQVLTTQKEAIRNLQIANEELKKLNLKHINEITRLKLKIDTLIHTPSDTQVVFIDSCSGKPKAAILLPYSWELPKDKYLSLKDSIDLKGDHFTRVSMDIPLDVWAGIDKDTKKPMVKVTTPNTYVKVMSITSLKFDTPKVRKWGIGVQMGYGYSLKRGELSPFIGIGINRNLIRF